ncbi:MAG: hypothetical protein ACRDUY_06310, partial [Nitriliruptorales bacterium]
MPPVCGLAAVAVIVVIELVVLSRPQLMHYERVSVPRKLDTEGSALWFTDSGTCLTLQRAELALRA